MVFFLIMKIPLVLWLQPYSLKMSSWALYLDCAISTIPYFFLTASSSDSNVCVAPHAGVVPWLSAALGVARPDGVPWLYGGSRRVAGLPVTACPHSPILHCYSSRHRVATTAGGHVVARADHTGMPPIDFKLLLTGSKNASLRNAITAPKPNHGYINSLLISRAY